MNRTLSRSAKSPAPTLPPDSRAGWRLRDWLAATSIGRSTFYVLPADIAPRQVRIGKKVVVLEAPASWLDRIARAGGVPKLRTA